MRSTAGATLASVFFAALLPPGAAASPSQDVSTPADVFARVELLRANLKLLRHYMGRLEPPAPLLRVESAQPPEVYSQALNLQLRANRLAFEQVRVVRSESSHSQELARPADVFAVVDDALAAVLLVKRHLGIATAVAEEARPEATMPGEVFNAIVAAGGEINHLLERQTSPSDVFQLITAAVHSAASLHVTIPDGPHLPAEPPFEPNKMRADVYRRMQTCFSLVRDVAGSVGMETLGLAVTDDRGGRVTPNDVADLAALIVEELAELHRRFPHASPPANAYYPGRRFPAHLFQRAGLLESILQDLAEAGGALAAESPGS